MHLNCDLLNSNCKSNCCPKNLTNVSLMLTSSIRHVRPTMHHTYISIYTLYIQPCKVNGFLFLPRKSTKGVSCHGIDVVSMYVQLTCMKKNIWKDKSNDALCEYLHLKLRNFLSINVRGCKSAEYIDKHTYIHACTHAHIERRKRVLCTWVTYQMLYWVSWFKNNIYLVNFKLFNIMVVLVRK